MDERLTTFWNELLTHCKKLNKFDFVFKVEYWGILWMPWFIYIDDKSLEFSVRSVSSEDMKWLVDNGYIEFIKEIEPIDSIDIKIEKYKIKKRN